MSITSIATTTTRPGKHRPKRIGAAARNAEQLLADNGVDLAEVEPTRHIHAVEGGPRDA